MIVVKKDEIRKDFLKLRKNADLRYIKLISRKISEKIINHSAYINSDVVYLYAAKGNEIDLYEVYEHALSSGKTILFPRVVNDCGDMVFCQITNKNQLVEGYKGILEPSLDIQEYDEDMSACSFMAVPGVAFDRNMGRIGMGKGYYDRFIRNHTINFLCGVCGEFQMTESIPMDDTDQYMDIIINDKEIFERL